MKIFSNKIFLLILAILLNFFASYKVFRDLQSPFIVFAWLVSLILLVVSQFPRKLKEKIKKREKPKFKVAGKIIIISLLVLLPSIVRVSDFNLNRLHGDDLLSAYFSANYNLKKDNFFGPVPKIRGEWVCQFPSPYFVFQKMFFLIFKENSLTVKLSIIPYILIVSIMLFLITKKILNEETAIISIFLYSFFSASLYLETLGLHFISSTAIFLIFFYFLISNPENNFSSVLAGIACGSCYLFYTSSYIALPFLFLFYLVQLISRKKIQILKNLFLAILGFSLTLGPFLTYIYKTKDFYFSGRFDQVNLLSGTWSGEKDKLKEGKTVPQIIEKNLKISVESFYKDGLGGHGGYDFNHLALFEKFSLAIFILGTILSLFLFLKVPALFWVWSTILVSFLAGMVLTIPPPPFHRFSTAFPFLILILSLPFYLVLKLKRIKYWLLFLIIIPVVFIYSLNNQRYFYKMTAKENDNANVRLTNFIITNYPDRNIYIAAFPGYNFERLFYFLKGNSNQKIFTEYHNHFLTNFNPKEKYIYVMIFPGYFEEKFQALDPKGKIIKFSNDYSLFAN